MDRLYPTRPFIGVLAIVRRDGRLLLVQRGKPPNLGLWGFPGGLQETGETVAEAAIRELREETSVTAGAPIVLPPYDVIERDGQGRTRQHFTLVPVVLAWLAGDASERSGPHAKETADAGWFTPEDMAALPLMQHASELAALAVETGPCPLGLPAVVVGLGQA